MTTEPEPLPAVRLNPWLSMWTKPRATMRQLLEGGFDKWNYTLAALVGIHFWLLGPFELVLPETLSWYTDLLVRCVLGVVFSFAWLPLKSWALRSTANTLGGKATYRQTRGAVAWASVIGVGGLLLWLPYLAATWVLSTSSDPDSVQAANLILQLSEWTLRALWVGWLIATLKCVAEVNGFSVWKAWAASIFANGLIAVVLLVPALIALAIYSVNVINSR